MYRRSYLIWPPAIIDIQKIRETTAVERRKAPLYQGSILPEGVSVLLRGNLVNRTYGIHKTYGMYLTIFTNNVWSY